MDFKTYYNDPKFTGSFSGKNNFFNAIKKENPLARRKDVFNYLKTDDAYTLHKPTKKPRRYRRIYTKGISYLYQLDLCDLSALSKENKGYKWIINVIDTFSKKLWSFKTKNKRGKTITNALKSLLTQNRPKKCETDGGTEFLNRDFLSLLKRLKVKIYNVYSDRKCAIVERVNRTLKTRMYRAFTARGSHVWYDILDQLVDGYNNSHHRSIKRTPNEVNRSNEAEVRAILFPREIRLGRPRFKLNDSVRITRKKSIFQKGYQQTWSYEVFNISEIKNSNPITYAIRDYNSQPIKGSFYFEELQLIDKSSGIFPIERLLRKRRSQGRVQYLVKYIGYSDIFNSWVDQQDLFNL